jgi:hypothetical protein
MTGDLPSSTPEESDGDKTAANKPTDNHKRQPQKKFKPAQTETGEEAPSWIDVSEGVGLVGSLVIWAEMIDCHALFQLLLYSAALLCCYVAICHLVYHKFFKKSKWSAKFSVVLWVILFLITSSFVYKNSLTELKPYPHLTLSLYFQDFPDDPVMMTNDFLFNKDFELTSKFPFRGALFVPMQSIKTNIIFSVSVKVNDDSPLQAEDLSVCLNLPKKLFCVPGTNWQKAQSDLLINISGSATQVQSWLYDLPNITPDLERPTKSFAIWPATTDKTFVNISVRALYLPPEELSFVLMPLTDAPRHKPFFVKANMISSNGMSYSKQEIWENFQK